MSTWLQADDQAGSPVVRVFILAGQSNMEGKGAILHLEDLLADPDTAEDFQHLREDHDWLKREDVSIKFLDQHGRLTVGFAKPTNRIGPELQFGHVVGDHFQEHVLIIKTAWGGRSLAVDFRPPSAGIGDYTKRDRKTREIVPIPDEDYGATYRQMIEEVLTTLDEIPKYVPDSAAGPGFELSGFVWFQGFNDVINDKYTAEYQSNLEHFIRDVRNDLNVPELPVVIGELGQQGVEPETRYADKHFGFRRMQKAVADLPEFKRHVAFVKTSSYVIPDGEHFDGGYHYYGRADTFFQIGNAFGKAMLLMSNDTPVNHVEQVQQARVRWSAKTD